MRVLVTGGAGYIGSQVVRGLLEEDHSVAVLDDLSTGHREAVPPSVPFVQADVGDRARVEALLREQKIEAILHLAARSQAGESVRDPRRYYTGNLAASIALLEAALAAGVGKFVLSSTAAVYGDPISVPITEDHPTAPINPYGETKLAIERMLAIYAKAYGLRYAALRYFNAAGADPRVGLGECHDPETHLIPNVLAAAMGAHAEITIHGHDYPTPDGTCIRDYIHVRDLADAHLASLAYLERGGESGCFNLSTGVGHSVNEVIAACRSVTGREIPVRHGPRREGDPPVLVASPRRAEALFGWRAQISSLDRLVSDAWAWMTSTARQRRASGSLESAAEPMPSTPSASARASWRV